MPDFAPEHVRETVGDDAFIFVALSLTLADVGEAFEASQGLLNQPLVIPP